MHSAATVRHDLKNPLGAISNSVYFLRARLVDPEEKVARHLDLIDSQVEHSLAVISSLLDFSKTVALEQKPHHLKSLVEECVAASVPDEVEVSVAIAEDIETVAMDRVQMSRVLRNILENSVHRPWIRGAGLIYPVSVTAAGLK